MLYREHLKIFGEKCKVYQNIIDFVLLKRYNDYV